MKRIHIILLFFPILWFCDLSAQEVWSKLGIGFNVNTQKLYGDSRSGDFTYGGSPFVLRYNLNPVMFLESDFSYGRLSAPNGGTRLETKMVNIGAKLGFRAMHESRINPIFYAGLGVFNFKIGNRSRYWDAYGAVGVGAELFVTKSLGANLMGDFRYTSGDDFDGSSIEQGNDGFFSISFGFNYYLGASRRGNYPGFTPAFGETQDDDFIREQFNSGPDLTLLAFQRDELLDSIEKKEQLIQLLRAKVEGFERDVTRLQSKLYASRAESSNGYYYDSKKRDPYFIQYQDGLAFYESGQFERAISVFKSLVKLGPENPRVGSWWYWLGESYFAAEDYFAAARTFETALTKNKERPKEQWIKLMLGMSRWKNGDVKQARLDFEELLNENPDDHTERLLQEYLADLNTSTY